MQWWPSSTTHWYSLAEQSVWLPSITETLFIYLWKRFSINDKNCKTRCLNTSCAPLVCFAPFSYDSSLNKVLMIQIFRYGFSSFPNECLQKTWNKTQIVWKEYELGMSWVWVAPVFTHSSSLSDNTIRGIILQFIIFKFLFFHYNSSQN